MWRIPNEGVEGRIKLIVLRKKLPFEVFYDKESFKELTLM
jgi:hypothetical protein